MREPIGPGKELYTALNPGEYQIADGDIELNKGRESFKLRVKNLGDRAVQLSSMTLYSGDPSFSVSSQK